MLNDILRLLRPQQWYKNILVYIAVFFSGGLFNLYELGYTSVGFVALCLVSSSNYIINDIMDLKKDMKHPEKKSRPLPSGKIKKQTAWFIAALLLLAGMGLAYLINWHFLIVCLSLFISTQIYSLFLRNEAFADVILIGINFVLRAVSGAVIVDAELSPWLIICAFFLALFMGLGKRRSDLVYLDKEAIQHRPTFRVYTKGLLDSLIVSILSIIIVVYSLYTFFKGDIVMMASLPVVVYAMFRYMHLIRTSAVARHPDQMFKDYRMDISILLWGIIIFFSLYLK